MKIYYNKYKLNPETGLSEAEEVFVDAVPDNPHCATDEMRRTWLERENGKWITNGIPYCHGGPSDAAVATRVEP